MDQAEPGKQGSGETPKRGPTEIPVDNFGDERGDDQYQKKKAAAESLDGLPIDRFIQRGLDLGVGGGKL